MFTEEEFAISVLLLTKDNYKSMKHKKTRAVILKEKQEVYDYRTTIDELVSKGYCNKAIDYEELKELHLKYGNEIKEKEFALNILELSLDSYRALRRCNNTTRFKILKNEIPREVERIMKLLISKGYTNKSCSLEEFESLYSKYGTFISERQFATQVLLVSISTYQDFRRNDNGNMTILPFRELSNNEIKEIKDELIKLGYEDKTLSKEEIDKLYLRYSNIMSKQIFKEKILEIYGNSQKKSRLILRKNDILDDEKIEDIKKTIYSKGYYYKKVKHDKVAELYSEFGNGLTYNTFIYNVLGISSKQISDAIYNDGYVRIIDINVKNTMDIITNKYITEIRYYSKEEILTICNNYNISLENFILYTLVKNNENNYDFYIEIYKEVATKRNKLWIGNSAISNTSIEKYYYEIEKVILRAIYKVKLLYPGAYKYSQQLNDDFQNALLFFIENGSELENNFLIYNDENWKKYFYNKIRKIVLYNALNRVKISQNDNDFFNRQDEDGIKRELVDNNTNVENDVLLNIEKDNYARIKKCILEFGNLLKNKKTINEAKENICNKYNISEYEFLEYMRIYADFNDLNNLDLNILNIDKTEENNNKIKLKKYKN